MVKETRLDEYEMAWRTDHASVACVICLQPVFSRGEGYVDASPADQVCRVCAERIAAALPGGTSKRSSKKVEVMA